MENPNFDIIAKEKFKFLETDYNFKIKKCTLENWGYTIIYLNNFVGIEIVYEFREAYVFIMLYKLIDGKLVYNSYSKGIINGCGLDDIILIKNPSALIKPTYEYGIDSIYYDKETGFAKYISENIFGKLRFTKSFVSSTIPFCLEVIIYKSLLFENFKK